MSAEMWQEWGPYALAAVAIFLGFLRNMGNAKNLELQMRGLYVDMSKEDRAARDRLQERVDHLTRQVGDQRVVITENIAERRHLKQTIETERKIHLAEVEKYEARITSYEQNAEVMRKQIVEMEEQNKGLSALVGNLKKQVEELQWRIDEVAARAADNASALQKETDRRLRVEEERDRLRQQLAEGEKERDALREGIKQLTEKIKQLEAEKANEKRIH